MSVRIIREDLFVEHNGCKFIHKPRNAGTVQQLGDLKRTDDLLEVAKVLITGWEGPVDDKTDEPVKFHKEQLKFMSILDLAAVLNLITDSYGIEIEAEGNSSSTSTT